MNGSRDHVPVPALTAADRTRFGSKLARAKSGCLIYMGSRTSRGYGLFSIKEANYYAHRVAWALAGRPFDDSRPSILHNCPEGDNPSCCNIDHLYAGTHQENMHDVVRKHQGRQNACGLPRGVRHRTKNRFQARCTYFGVEIYLGSFHTVEEAAEAAQAARDRILAGEVP